MRAVARLGLGLSVVGLCFISLQTLLFEGDGLLDFPSLKLNATSEPENTLLVVSCESHRRFVLDQYQRLLPLVNLKQRPSHNMPWYFHDPYPLCGKFLLFHLFASRFVFALQVANSLGRTGFPSAAFVLSANEGEQSSDVTILQCGSCVGGDSCSADILIMARLIGGNGYQAAVVRRSTTDPFSRTVLFRPLLHGNFSLEVKLVHVNGSCDDPTLPLSLGVIGIRTVEHNRKSYRVNSVCDFQRHVEGSPLQVRIKPAMRTSIDVPLCTEANHTVGRWVRFTPGMCYVSTSPFCKGNPSWLSDASGFNEEMLWAPEECKYEFWSPPRGPTESCLSGGRRAFFLLIGDSVIREYSANCQLFDFRSANLMCLFNNIALEGRHFSVPYARSVVQSIVGNILTNNPGVFATNLGIHHMIGPCNTSQWRLYVELFAAEWKQRVHFSRHAASVGETPVAAGNDTLLEKAVWLGPPTIHYAMKGMGFQRAALWDRIAWDMLEPLGFQRVYAIAPTESRQESTWDGLHYAAQRGRPQSPWKNRNAVVRKWNGGVANMLFTMLLNVVCNNVKR